VSNDSSPPPEDSQQQGPPAPGGPPSAEEPPKRQPDRSEAVELNLYGITDLPSNTEIETPLGRREKAAEKIAAQIVLIFGGAVLGTLSLDFLLIGLLLLLYKCDGQQFENIVSKGIVPLLTTTGTFVSTIFGPLLAFVLGYYFSQKGEQSDGSKKQQS
jgi:hypothetical protein